MSDPQFGGASIPLRNCPSLSSNERLPFWLRTIVIIGAVLLTMGAVICVVHPARLVSPHDEINPAVRVYAGYTFSRDLGLAMMLVVAMALRARATLNSLMLLTGFIQVFDGAVDYADHRYAIIPGVLVIGAMFLLGAAALSGAPFWKAQAWRQNP